jgi:hypothetical protein
MNRNPGYQQHWQVNVVLVIASTAIGANGRSPLQRAECALYPLRRYMLNEGADEQ